MIWAGVNDLTGRMGVLHDRLDEALSGMGFKEQDRDFNPHITMARIKFAKDPSALRRAVRVYRDEDFGSRHAREVAQHEDLLLDRLLASEQPYFRDETPSARELRTWL